MCNNQHFCVATSVFVFHYVDFPSLPLIIMCVMIVFSSELNYFPLSVRDQRNIHQMYIRCSAVCSYSYIYICFCFGSIWRTKRCLYNRVITDFYNHIWVVACKRRARRLSASWRYEEFEHVPCVPSATRSSPCSTASPATSSWWRLGTHRPKCWTGTASTSWSVSRETSTLWIWPTPRWGGASSVALLLSF